jgi:hypothetical protein
MKLIQYVPIEYFKTFDDILRVVKLTDIQKMILDSDDPSIKQEKAHLKIKLIAFVFNCDWEPDWSDNNRYKYYPWFNYNTLEPYQCELLGVPIGSSGFSYDDYRYQAATTGIAGRLCFKTKDLAEHAGKLFWKEYMEWLG